MKRLIGFRLFRSKILVAIGVIWCVSAAGAMQANTPPKELVEWVSDARHGGMNEDQIRKNAAAAGWPDDAVVEALRATAPESSKGPASAPESAKPAAAAPVEPKAEPSKPPAGETPLSVGPSPAAPKDQPAAATAPSAPAGAPSAGGPAPAGTLKPPVDRGVPDDYQIGAGDVLHIAVWHEPDATVPSVVVRPDGKISMPLLKDVPVVGLTPTQLEKQLTEQLTKFLAAPDVTVMVTGINSKKIYLIGAVKREGPIAYTYRMSVLQALSEAGGLTDYAKRKKIYVLRNENGRDFKLSFDYDAALKGEHMELNIPLIAGDTIVVPH